MSVEKDVLYADRAKFFPWRPRLWLAAYDILLYSALAQALMLAWALLSPLTAGTQPVIWCKWGGGCEAPSVRVAHFGVHLSSCGPAGHAQGFACRQGRQRNTALPA